MQRIPPVVKNLLIINGLVFVLELLLVGNGYQDVIVRYFFLHKIDLVFDRPYGNELFQPLQVVTSIFSHSPSSLFHILVNMFALFSIGTPVENVIGSRRFLNFYLFSGVVGAFMTALFDPNWVPVLGASGAVSGVAVAFALLYPNQRLVIFPLVFISFKAINLISFFFLMSLAFVVYAFIDPTGAAENSGGISHFGHLAGMVAALAFIFGQREYNRWQRRNR